jgi:DNA-binding PadR family transcriptional regulator
VRSKSETPVGRSRRKRIVYAITQAGREQFESSVEAADPDTWDDENFEIRFAFFGPTPVGSRLRYRLDIAGKYIGVLSNPHIMMNCA